MLSTIMIDPTGERTIVAFRDPDLWKVKLGGLAAAGLRRSADREPLAEFCTDLCTEAIRRGIRVIVDVDRARSLSEALLLPIWCFPPSRCKKPPAKTTTARR